MLSRGRRCCLGGGGVVRGMGGRCCSRGEGGVVHSPLPELDRQMPVKT